MTTRDKINTAVNALNPTSPYYEYGRLAFSLEISLTKISFSNPAFDEAFHQGWADAREEEYETRLLGAPAPQ